MSITLFIRSALARLHRRNDFPAHVSVLASQASERLNQLSVTLERYTDQEKGLTPRLQSQKALFNEMDWRFHALGKKLDELQDIVAKHRKKS